MKPFFITLLLLTITLGTIAQTKQFTFQSSNAMFPDNKNNPKYSSNDPRYNDNSTIVYVPRHFDKNKPWQYFLWFHGWNNNIHSTIEQFRLREQLDDAGINAILIMPEAAKDAPDSYCGKWEQPGYFDKFMNDAKQKLIEQKVITNNADNHALIIAGHSGASRVLVQIMIHTTIPIKGIMLFDAISGYEDKIITCLKKNSGCKLINLYTNKPNTNASSLRLLEMLKNKKMCVVNKEDTQFNEADINECRILSLHTKLSHNDVATSNSYIKRFLNCMK